MFLMRWYSRLRIRTKLFLMTTSIIMVCAVVLFVGMYSYMPQMYADYKTFEVEGLMNAFAEELQTTDDYVEATFEFSYNENIQILMIDENERILYPTHPSNLKYGPGSSLFNHFKFNSRNDKEKGMIYVEKSVYIESIDEQVDVIMASNFKPIDDAMTLIVLFIPFMIALVLAMALVTTYINIKLVTRPFLRINAVAKNVAKLDFSSELVVQGEDEIAELSQSINEMSRSLETTIMTLKSDIEREREAEKNRREFIATISHELKSPLTIITGQLEGMKMNIGKYKDHETYLAESLAVAKNMQQLVGEIISLNKLESVQLVLHKRKVNITKIIYDILEEQQYFIEKRQLDVTLHMKQDYYIEADEILLKRALRNIIENACFYSTKSVNIKLDHDKLIIENSYDDFPKAEVESLFKPFYRLEKSRNRQTGGSGLGLYIVKMILDKHEIAYEFQTTAQSVAFILMIHHV